MITDWLDGFNRAIAERFGLDAERVSTALGGELIANVIEAIYGWTTKGWVNNALNVGTGLLATLYGLTARGLSTRFRYELLQLGAHEILTVLPKTPEEYDQLQKNWQDFLNAISSGMLQRSIARGIRASGEVARPFSRQYSPARPAVRVVAPAPAEEKKVEVSGTRVLSY